ASEPDRTGWHPSTWRAPCRRCRSAPSPRTGCGQHAARPAQRSALCLPSSAILLVADVVHPLDNFAVQPFLDGDVGHRGGWRGAVPVLLARGEPDHITRADFLNWSALALHPAATGGDDKCLAERVGVPCGARAGLER